MRSKSGPGGTLYQYGLCELAQRQAVFVRKDKSSDRAIKSDRAKVVMTAGCVSKNKPIFPHQKTSELFQYKVLRLFSSGAIGAIRTRDPLLRRQMLYPAELQPQQI